MRMSNSNVVCRRAVAVVLLVAALVVVPAGPAIADGDSTGGQVQASGNEAGVVERVLDWLVNLLAGSSETEGAPDFDPAG
jgi:hypothetical protein